LTFGPRPGDTAAVQRIGLKKWIDQQLHPETITENPVLGDQLKPLKTLDMTSREIAREYPPPQMIIAVATGKAPLPQDPELRELYSKLAERYKKRILKKTGNETSDAFAKPDSEPEFRLDDILTEDQIR